MYAYNDHGFEIVKGAISDQNISNITNELLKIGNNLDKKNDFNNLDDLWNHYSYSNREKGSSIYNGFKYLPSISSMAYSDLMKSSLKKVCNINNPALIDINCRIDSRGDEKYLFDWHQDYWFSVSSKNAVVVWIPITGLKPSMGGLEIIPFQKDDLKIYKTKAGDKYESYADAVKLDDVIPTERALRIESMSKGSALFFSFSSLHKSLPITDKNRSRFTIQLRFVDFDDEEFIANNYKPGQVSQQSIDYLTLNT
jgi:hypothetical protein